MSPVIVELQMSHDHWNLVLYCHLINFTWLSSIIKYYICLLVSQPEPFESDCHYAIEHLSHFILVLLYWRYLGVNISSMKYYSHVFIGWSEMFMDFNFHWNKMVVNFKSYIIIIENKKRIWYYIWIKENMNKDFTQFKHKILHNNQLQLDQLCQHIP